MKRVTGKTVADILSHPLLSSDGKKIGRVIDIEVDPEAEFEITTLLIGRYGLLHRLHVLHPFARLLGVRPAIDTIRWEDVQSVDDEGRILLRMKYEEFTQEKAHQRRS